jgi:hypothetical protein
MNDVVMFTKNSKSLLAKLMAEEDISVQHKNIETAYFDVKNRVLALPLWKDMSGTLYDLLVGHEVGHALYTPSEEGVLENAIKRSNKAFVNVVEDARIEKLMKRKFPGLRSSFFKGYDELHDKDFFGIQRSDFGNMSFIDKINVFFKYPSNQYDLKGYFTAEELPYVKMVAETETFAEVADVAEKIFNFISEKVKEEKENQMQNSVAPSDAEENPDAQSIDVSSDSSEKTEETDGSGDADQQKESENENDNEGSESSSEEKVSANGGDNVEPSDSEEKSTTSIGGKEGGSGINDNEFVSQTATDLADALKELIDHEASITYLDIPKFNANDYIIQWTEVRDDLAKKLDMSLITTEKMKNYWTNSYTNLLAKHNKTISYLVKEFEMKKSADEYAKSYIAKSGNINSNKLWSFQLNDDIFKKKNVIPEGKNHGMVMLVDWSGSMHRQLVKTVEQTIILATFCRRVGIPFEVYNFSDQNRSTVDKYEILESLEVGDHVLSPNVKLHCMLSHKMKKSEFYEACRQYINLAYANVYHIYGVTYELDQYRMGGTPLNDSLIILDRVVDKFRKENSVQKMSFVVLTDGEAGDHFQQVDETAEGQKWISTKGFSWRRTYNSSTVFVKDKNTGTFFSYDTKKHSQTDAYLDYMKKKHNASSIGFYVVNNLRDLKSAIYNYMGKGNVWTDTSSYLKESRKNGFLTATKCGYDEYYILDMRNQGSEDELEVSDSMTNAKIAKQFAKFQSKKKTSRQLLNKFVDLVK